ncbi:MULTISPECIES: hypothetical protein [Celeribacter]|jgi:hypothetical protein|uniref:PEP-CTERM protein-sorting domain-containing protein n=1 Tax=Celeribacter halophilus TaxID=576117 RepID=A0AAW7XN10_9RHOB|nr:hypothetical protein [Celeribacter halophilus]MBU2890748.1 hypothetical protein [Celeribacter halophilus]MDO6455500.1 hypothetical protein [Celeribacter halophilus]MDO6510087.1 hypothetical protein [Celeribacter halophilus]MDO6721704.1 hypothetical protein [Celeribacter halophilus]
MRFDLFPMFLASSAGIGLGVFIGVFIGLLMRVKAGKREGLIMNSVAATSFLASVAALVLSALIKLVSYSG